jgi:hypothetical protein
MANIIMKNPWALDYYRQEQLASSPDHPLWSRNPDDIKAYMAYQLQTDSKIKAQMRLQFPWLSELPQQISDYTQASINKNQVTQQNKAGQLSTQMGNMLGVYNPPPSTPSTPYTKMPPNPYDSLTPQQKQVADAYTAMPAGTSPAKKQLLAQNPWLKGYWDQRTQYYQQNPIQTQGPVADYLRSIGINPDTTTASTTGGYQRRPRMQSLVRRPTAKIHQPKAKKLSLAAPKMGKTLKVKRVKFTAMKQPSIKRPKIKI